MGHRQRAAADGRRRRHRRLRDPRRQRQPDRARLRRERDRGPRLGPRVPARRAGLRRGRRAGRHARGRDPRPPHQGLGLDGDPARPRPAGRRLHRALPARLRPQPGDVTLFREDIIIPLAPFMGTMGVCPADASAQPIMPPGTFGGNLDTRQLVAGHDAVPAGPGRGRAVQHRRRPRLPGRRRDLRHRPRGPDVRRHALPAGEGPLDPRAAVPHRARPAHARRQPRRASTAPPASAATSTWPPRTRRGR